MQVPSESPVQQSLALMSYSAFYVTFDAFYEVLVLYNSSREHRIQVHRSMSIYVLSTISNPEVTSLVT